MNYDEAVLDALRSTAVLADVSVGVWSGERTDPAVTDKVKKDAGATVKPGRFIKHLLAGSDEPLKAAKSAHHAVSAMHRDLTLPWGQSVGRAQGPRLLPNEHAMDYLRKIGAAKAQAQEALDRFISTYDANVASAKASLQGMADAQYPSADAVREAFYVKVEITPLPTSGKLLNMPDAYADALRRDLGNKQSQMLAAAQNAIWTQAREHLTTWRDRLLDPESRFKDAFVHNAQGVMNAASGWNIAGDPRVVEMLAMWKREGLDLVTPVVLRKHPENRKPIGEAAGRILAKLDEWGVGV